MAECEVIDVLMCMNGQHHPQRREQLIERFQLEVTKKCRTYSKGNRQKVAFIREFLGVVSVVALALALIGYVGYRRRDLAT